MTHPLRRSKQLEIEARRARVASLLLAGVSDQSKIAEQVGVDRSTISRDIKVIESEWQASALQDISAAKGKDLDRSEHLIAALWDKARDGDERSIAQVLNLMQHRAKLLGLNAPEKRELSGDENAPLTVLIQRVNREVSE